MATRPIPRCAQTAATPVAQPFARPGLQTRVRAGRLAYLGWALALALALLLPGQPLLAQSSRPITVTTGMDTLDAPCNQIDVKNVTSLGGDHEISLREAICAANNTRGDDTIRLAHRGRYVLSLAPAGEDLNQGGDFDIAAGSRLTIQGQDPEQTVIARAAGAGAVEDRIFHVLTDAVLILDRVTVHNGLTPGNGGGILNAGELIVSESIIAANQAHEGGGIYSEAGVATLEGSRVAENVAQNLGGGFYVDFDSELTLSDVEIVHNQATNGGGLYNGGVLQVSGGSFAQNSAALSGGALVNNGPNMAPAVATLDNVLLEENLAQGPGPALQGGGAIFNYESQLTLDGSTVRDNQAELLGGGIMNVRGDMTVRDGDLSGNRSDGHGGGIYDLEGAVELERTVLIENDTTNGSGGGYAGIQDSSLTVVQSTIAGNSALGYGGGIHLLNGHATIEQSLFFRNQSGDAGGALMVSESMTEVVNSTFSDNHAGAQGGAVYFWISGDLALMHNTLTANSSQSDGGGLAAWAPNGTLTLFNNLVSGNSAAGLGQELFTDFTFAFDGASNLYGHQGVSTAAALANFSLLPNDGLATSDGGSAAMLERILNTVLQDNGGPTLTHALPNGSPALDIAARDKCPQEDQRGAERPQGRGCDIGAFEAELPSQRLGQVDPDQGETTARTVFLPLVTK